ncbi:MAG TPA: NAD(P)-dependent oxidoreductase [bacterium]
MPVKIAYLAKARPDLKDLIPQDIEHVVVQAGAGGVYGQEDLERVADADAFVISMEPVNEQILAACPQVKIAQRLGVGYETMDLRAAAKRGVPCCNVPGVNKEAVAEHGMTLILALVRRILESDRLTRDMKWSEARILTGDTFELYGKTIGIVGLGNTGFNLAKRARAFGMRVVYNDIREIEPERIEAVGAQFMSKEDLYQEADIVSVNTDLNDQSRNMIDARALELMGPRKTLVCCARGGIIDEQALADALNAGRLRAAGIDVFAEEPVHKDNPLLTARNCIVTAHVAGVTDETTRRIFEWAHDNVRAVVERGEKPKWVLNGV